MTGGVAEGLTVAKTAWGGVGVVYRFLSGRRITITDPAPQAVLKDPLPLGKGVSYRVRGKLKRLPKAHRLWLLIEDERTGDVWPQGFQAVQHNPESGEWEGRVNPWDRNVLIHAVVAPPTSDDLFRFFQQAGDRTEKWAPLRRIPPECSNRATVQASKP